MDHADITARIDRRLAKRKPSVSEGYFAKWERQWDTRYGRSKPTQAAVLFDRSHERAMREAMEVGRA